MNKLFLSFLLLFYISFSAAAEIQQQNISSFDIKSNLADRLTVSVLVDGNEEQSGGVNEINGSFDFSINGIDKKLQFKNGEAVVFDKISSSTFLYIRPIESTFSELKLYYVLKVGEKLFAIHVPIFLLLVIPLFFFILGYFVRRLLVIAILLFIVFFIFNKGLSIGNYLHVIYQWLLSFL
ncbi:hypothetical protein [Solitalea koreensis]|uniref:Uncharacterized protein n=1 Tax=Solitalea koreensis TaxID=543615 RepID=A0A521D6G9_9SPHI|nr:hypothetical protein [Solitalea koreensis]SMO67269.1 hypothetical protein SAMN06265350_1065 [Solitalea koreensis]